MFDSKKLEAAMVEAGVSSQALAKKLGISEATFHRKFAADGDFRWSEINIIIQECHIDNPLDIFFADELA